ncbi:MAG: hypothetical protein WDN06_15470 [Asticcacaulis sp.]
MNDFTEFTLAMWDAFRAAMIGLNPLPAIIISLLIGMMQAGRGGYIFKAIAAVVPAVAITSLLPALSSIQPIWPDLSQLETEIQIGVLIAVSYVVIRLTGMIKQTLSVSARQPKKA